MSEEDMARYVVYGLDGDPEVPCIGVCPNSTDMGPYIINLVGVGNPYFAFTTLPSEILTCEDGIGANFNTGALCSADYQTNRNSVAAQYANPPEVATTPQDPETTTAVCWPVV